MLNLLLIKLRNNKPIINRCKLCTNTRTQRAAKKLREREGERERARTKKLTR